MSAGIPGGGDDHRLDRARRRQNVAMTPDAATASAWAALGGPVDLVGGVAYEPARGVLPARLPVREMARATVGVCSLAAAELLARRNGGAVPAVRVSEAAVGTAFVSERHLRIDGRAPTVFAPLSGFWRASDGWVRTHANYPHHRDRLLGALGVGEGGELAAALAERPAEEIQETVYAAGGLAVAVAPSAFGSGSPLVETRDFGAGRVLPRAVLPADGVRVLDLTRVIAGPVATRTLALLGADVLRVDSPRLPESEDAHADTGLGKRSTLLDLADSDDRRIFDDLLAEADVVVTGYRPGALDRLGLSPDDLLDRRPGLVVAQLCAWGWDGPWALRRGFDSLVQAACGIAVVEGGERPGVLPAQALDHGTGYLLAAAVLRALAEGRGRHVRLSLAGTASWLMDVRPVPEEGPVYDAEPWVVEVPSPYGVLRHALSPVGYEGGPEGWSKAPSSWGKDVPRWN
jgi:CoA transferase family III